MKKVLRVLIIIFIMLVLLVLLDSVQALIFNNNVILGIESKCQRKSGLLVDTYHCDNGNISKFKLFEYKCEVDEVCGKTIKEDEYQTDNSIPGDTSPVVGTDNYVSYNGRLAYPVNKVEINGVKSNAKFMVSSADKNTISIAEDFVTSINGELVSIVSTSSPGVSFDIAKVKFFVDSVEDNDSILVYQLYNDKWVQLSVSEVRKDHVMVNMTKNGVLIFVRSLIIP